VEELHIIEPQIGNDEIKMDYLRENFKQIQSGDFLKEVSWVASDQDFDSLTLPIL
jgi:hypothetical protein